MSVKDLLAKPDLEKCNDKLLRFTCSDNLYTYAIYITHMVTKDFKT